MSEFKPQSFREAFCRDFGCPEDAFERRALLLCFYPRAALLYRLFPFRTRGIQAGLYLMQWVGVARSAGDVSDAIENYYRWVNLERSWLMTRWKFRVSGTRILRLQERLFPGSTTKSSENTDFVARSEAAAEKSAPRRRMRMPE